MKENLKTLREALERERERLDEVVALLMEQREAEAPSTGRDPWLERLAVIQGGGDAEQCGPPEKTTEKETK